MQTFCKNESQHSVKIKNLFYYNSVFSELTQCFFVLKVGVNY